MKAKPARGTPDDVVITSNALTKFTGAAMMLIIVPLVLFTLWLSLIRESGVQARSASAIADAIVTSRAELIHTFTNTIFTRLENLASKLPPTMAGGPLQTGLVSDETITVIPLDDLGTVHLSPGQFGISSHIEVDLVRRAFAGDDPAAEVLTLSSPPQVLFARPYGAPPQGVLLARLPIHYLEGFVTAIEGGSFQLLQRSNANTIQVIAGNASNTPASSSTPIPGGNWSLAFTSRPDWLAQLAPEWISLAIGLVLFCLFTLGACLMLLFGIPRVLRRESARLLEATKLRSPLQIQIPELLPLAQQLRHLYRRQQFLDAGREMSNTAPRPNTPPTGEKEQAPIPPAEIEEDTVEPDNEPEVPNDDLPAHIFRETCIRGDADNELTDDLVEKIGFAIAIMAKDRGIQTLVLANDSRASSKRIRAGLVKALLASGIDILDMGEAPSPLLNFALHEGQSDSGIMITGSHSADNINGMKIYLHRAEITGPDIQQLLDSVRQGQSIQGSGRLARQDMEPEYVDRVLMEVALALPLKLVIDTRGGAVGQMAPALCQALGCEVVSLDAPDDSRSQTLEVALATLGEQVKREHADIGVLFDTDGDRLLTVSETGDPVEPDQLLMLLARDILERNPGADVVCDLGVTRQFGAFISHLGGRALVSRTGQAFLQKKMQEEKAILAGDTAGHLFIGERWFGFADAIYALARLLEILSNETASYAQLLPDLGSTVKTPEFSVAVDQVRGHRIIQDLATSDAFTGARTTTLEGLRVEWPEGWGLIRTATSDDALCFRFEGNDAEGLRQVQNNVRSATQSVAPDLELPF